MNLILAALFVACSLVCWLHVRQIIRDKTVKGVSLIPTFVFMTTNVFEMIYFGQKGDWWNVGGAVSMLMSNVAWTVCVFYYHRKEKQRSWAGVY